MAIQFLNNVNADSGTLYVDAENNLVGIGTTSPKYKLEVSGTLGVSRTDGIIFAGSAGTGTGSKIASNTSNDLIFSTALSSSPYTTTERVRILNNGNVGIRTTSPSYTLDVEGPIRGKQYLYLKDTSGTNRLTIQAESTYVTHSIGALAQNFVANYYRFYDDTFSEMMRIADNGNVGIGTTAPGAKLEVNGNSRFVGSMQFYQGSTSNQYLHILQSSSNTYINTGTSGETIYFGAPATNTTNLNVQGTGTFQTIANATSDTDKFLVSDSGVIKYRTGAELAADIGAVTGGPFLPLAGGTMTGDARFNDNVYARFGATGTGDLIIGHADFGSPYSVILENGSGDLKIQATNLVLESANGETYIDCNFNSSVDLYHNNVKKFETLSTGATVTGKLGIDTTSPNTQIEVFNNNDQTSTLRLSTSNTSAGDVSGEISFAFDGTTVGAKIQSVINNNEDGTDLKLDCANTTLTGNLEASGYVKAVDGYKGYVSDFNNGGFFHSPRSTDGANPLWIPINTTGMSSSDQYYNTWVPLYAGRVRKIILKYISGSTPVATACTFRKKINGTLSSTTYAGTVTNGGTTSMKVTFDFGTTNFTFNAEDEVQIGVVTGVATQPRMGGMSYQIWYEYNVT